MPAPGLERPREAPQQEDCSLRGEGSGQPVQRPEDSMAQQPCSDGLQRGPHCGPAVDAGDPHGGQYLRMQQRLARQLSRAFGSGRLSGGAAAALRELCPSARFFRCARRRLFGCFFKPVAPESRARAVQRGSGRAERRARLGAEHGQHAGRRAAPRRAAAARRRRGLLAAAEPLAAHRARRPAPARPCTPGRSLIAGRRAASGSWERRLAWLLWPVAPALPSPGGAHVCFCRYRAVHCAIASGPLPSMWTSCLSSPRIIVAA